MWRLRFRWTEPAFAVGVALLGLLGCAAGPIQRNDVRSPALVFLTRPGCVQTPELLENLRKALRRTGHADAVEIVDAEGLPPGNLLGAYGTPTILLDGSDLFDLPAPRAAVHAPT